MVEIDPVVGVVGAEVTLQFKPVTNDPAFLYLSAAPGRAGSDWDLRVMKIPVRMRQTRMHLRPQESPPGFKCQT
jgi:hypothetical protein